MKTITIEETGIEIQMPDEICSDEEERLVAEIKLQIEKHQKSESLFWCDRVVVKRNSK